MSDIVTATGIDEVLDALRAVRGVTEVTAENGFPGVVVFVCTTEDGRDWRSSSRVEQIEAAPGRVADGLVPQLRDWLESTPAA